MGVSAVKVNLWIRAMLDPSCRITINDFRRRSASEPRADPQTSSSRRPSPSGSSSATSSSSTSRRFRAFMLFCFDIRDICFFPA